MKKVIKKKFDFRSINFLKTLEASIILIPFFLITGPFLSDLALSYCSLGILFYLKDNKLKKYFFSKFFLFFLIFWLFVLISSFFAYDPYLSLKNTIFYFRFALFCICFAYLIEKDKNLLKKLYISTSICFISLILDGIFQYNFGYNIFGYKIIEIPRVSSLFGDELIYGSYLSRFFPLLVGLHFFYFSKKNSVYELILIFYFFFTMIAVFLSGERTAFIIIIYSTILIFLLYNNYKKEKYLIISLLILSLSTIYFSNFTSKERIFNLTKEQMNIDNFLENKDQKIIIFNQQYQEHYMSALKIFHDHPFIGIGPKNFRIICSEEKYNFSELTCSTHPHHIYLQILAETGIINFFIILYLYLQTLYLLAKAFFYKFLKNEVILDNLQLSLLIHISVCLLPIIPSGNFFNNWLSIVFYFPLGIFIWSIHNKKRN